MDDVYKIYWIKYSEYDDPKTQGYVGLTSQEIYQRFNDHKNNTKNHLLKNRCRKENVEIVCLHDNLDKQSARKIEEEYRPYENIGWNINKGGDLPPSRKGKTSPKSLLKGNDRTENQKNGSKRQAEKIKGNKFSSTRKNKKDKNKLCANCGVLFIAKENKTKYCCMSCAAIKRNENPEYIKKLSEKTKLQWKNKLI